MFFFNSLLKKAPKGIKKKSLHQIVPDEWIGLDRGWDFAGAGAGSDWLSQPRELIHTSN